MAEAASLRMDGESSPRVWLALLAAFLILFSASTPMLLILPMWIVVYLLRNRLAAAVALLPRDYGFVAAALVFGLLTESFAILSNLSRPPSERILLDPDPARDLALALVYYSAVAVTWLLLMRRFAFRGRDVFIVTALYGVLVEQMGQVAIHVFTWPIEGALYGLLVAFVYGLFPMLALMVAGARFGAGRRSAGWRARLMALAALLAQWAIVGLLVFPAVRRVIGK